MKSFLIRVVATPLLFIVFSSAMADDRVFLLQLGSYESRAEAQGRWDSVVKAYPDLFNGLSLRLLDVTLPPDNFTVYRTQAGALSSQADAQLICEKLTARGDECYVVETAMFNPDETPFQAPAAQLAAPLNTAPEIAAAPADIIELPPVEMASGLQQPVPIMQAPQTLPEQSLPEGAGLDASKVEREPSFWTRINPFSPEDQQAAQPTFNHGEPVIPVAPAPEPSATALVLPPPPPSNPAYAQGQVASNMPVTPAPPLVTLGAPNASDMTLVQQPAPIMQEPQPIASLPSSVPFEVKGKDGRPTSLSAAPSAQFIAAGDEVRVAEAVPVPVTNDVMQRPSTSLAPFSAQQLRALGTPSQEVKAGKNLWAEVKFFESQQEALAFWNEFRALNPNFPPARVRLTNPYAASSNALPRIALSVGPFEHDTAIAAICAQVRGEEAQCQTVRELGNSTLSTSNLDRTKLLPSQRSSAIASFGQPMYWVQLGGYTSASAAHAGWEELRLRHAPMLEKATPNVSSPPKGSSLNESYRLRTGPYAMRPQADALCQQILSQGGNCMTVFSN